MIRRILSTAATEARIAARNRWVAIAVALMAVFALVLAVAGSAPTGGLGVDPLSVTVASLTSLSVYLVPLLALLMSFDAVAGEAERGTLPLLLTYPVARGEVLAGKLLAAKRELRLEAELNKLDRYEVLILDDIGYIQQSREEMEGAHTRQPLSFKKKASAHSESDTSHWGGFLEVDDLTKLYQGKILANAAAGESLV
jgi:hypothetical protein